MISAFCEVDEGGVHTEPVPFHARPGGEVGHRLVRRYVLGPAVRVAAVVEGVHPDEDVSATEGLSPGEREGKENGVAGRHVGDGDARAQVLDPVMVRAPLCRR